MSAPFLQVWSAPKCQAGAAPIGSLPAFVSAAITESLGGAESGALVLPADVALAAGVAEGRIVRASIPLRGTVEWVITAVQDSDPASTVTVQLGPLRQLLALRGLIRTETGGVTTLAFTPEPATPAALLTRYLLTNLAVDGLEWLSLGTIEPVDTLFLAQQTAVTRGALLAELERLTGCEAVLRPLASDAGYAIDLLRERGAALEPVLLEPPARARSIQRTRELQQAATVVMPLVDGDQPLGEVTWTAASVVGAGPYWIALTDPENGAGPIREDGQFVGAYLGLPDGTALPLVATRASDSAVQVASLGTLQLGSAVVLWADTQGRPVSEIASPSALQQARGRVVATVRVAGGGVERNLLRNPGFAADATAWNAVNGTSLASAIRRTDLGITVAGLVNGARAAATGTGTPLGLDGVPAGTRFYRGDTVRIAGTTCAVTADAVPSSTGALTLTVFPGLPGDMADGAPVTLQRRDVRTLTLDGAQSVLLPTLQFTDSNTGNLLEGATGTLASTSGGYTATTGALAYVTGGTGVRAGKVRLTMGDPNTGSSSLNWPTANNDIFALPVVSIVSLSGNTGVFLLDAGFSGTITANVTRVRYYNQVGRFEVARVTSVVGSTLTVVSEVYATLTYPALWPGDTFNMVASNMVLSSGSTWTYTEVREDRPLQLNGAHVAGATTLTMRAQSVIATRNWVATDTITLARTITPTLDLTSVGTPTYETTDDGVAYWVLTATFASGTSTMDDVAPADYAGRGLTFQSGTSAAWGFAGFSGSTVTFAVPGNAANTTALPTGVVSTTWTVADTYALSGTASWGNNGRVTLTLASAVPSGRSYTAGVDVEANWHPYRTGSGLRLSTALTAGGTTVELVGNDGYIATSSPSAALPLGVYRVMASGSSLPIPGDILTVGADATANGSGAASLTLAAANTNAISDNVAFAITRPALLSATDRTTGAVMRLFASPGSAAPSASVAAWQSDAVFVFVPDGVRRRLTAKAWFVVTPETLTASTAPVLALFNVVTGAVVATAAVPATTYTEPATAVAVSCGVDLTSAGRFAIRLYGGSISAPGRWHLCKEAALYLGADTDVPFFAESRSRVAFQRGQDVLAQRRSSARYTVTGIDQATLAAVGTPIQLGQRARLRAPALALDTTQRIVRLVWRWPGAELVELECEALTPRFTDVA